MSKRRRGLRSKVALGFCGRRGCYNKRFSKDEDFGFICEAHFYGQK